MKVLVTADIDRRIEQEFPNLDFYYAGYSVEPFIPSTHQDLKRLCSDSDFLICEFDTIDKDIIDEAKKLKLIICCRGGVHSVVDVGYAAKKGIVVKNTPARNARAVAEYVLGVILNTDRFLEKANNLVLNDILQNQSYVLPKEYKDSLWGMDSLSPYHIFRGKGLHNITLGVIGYGNVGRTVTNMAILLGIHVLVYDQYPVLGPIPTGVEIVSKEFLLQNSDYVSLHCSNKSHKVVIGEAEFEKMRKDTFFINTARGDLVDESALIKALNDGLIKGAALDVTCKEPLPPKSQLISTSNIFITPHIAGSTDEVIQTGTDMVIYYLREYLSEIMEESDE